MTSMPTLRPITNESEPAFQFPRSHSFPPLYSIQPNPNTRLLQFQKWSRTIQLYCRHYRLFRLSLPACFELPLFRNMEIKKKLAEEDVRVVLSWMASEEGAMRGEWVGKDGFWVFWKRPEDWGDSIRQWVEDVGQKGAVLTFYELLHGEGSVGQGFHDMDAELFERAMNSLVKRGKAQVFGDEDSKGIKFF